MNRVWLSIVALIVLLVQPVSQAGTPDSAAKAAAGGPTLAVANCAQYVGEEPPYDYATVPKNAWLNKTWYIKNCGTATWTTSWGVDKISGNVCGSFNFTKSTAPGATATVTARCYLGAPAQYQARFRVKTAGGTTFGDEFWFVVNAN